MFSNFPFLLGLNVINGKKKEANNDASSCSTRMQSNYFEIEILPSIISSSHVKIVIDKITIEASQTEMIRIRFWGIFSTLNDI
jgi:hypothetical protein